MNERQFTSSDGVALCYDDFGPADGAPVVLCHGLAAQALQFADDALFLAGKGHRVLVPDLRGHGRSGAPAISPENFSIARLAADLREMLDDAGVGPVHWVGNSLGGIVALEMLPMARFATLTTFGTAYALGLPKFGGHRLVSATHAAFGAETMAVLGSRSVTNDPHAREVIAEMLRRSRPAVTEVLAEVLTQYDLIANAVAATLPILLLRGGRDRLVNAGLGSTLKAMQGRPNFTLVEVPEGGHCANLDARDAFRAALLGFWARQRGA